MNKENAHLFDEVFQALKAGKTIQYFNSKSIWEDIEETAFCLPADDYRVKPEPREWTVLVATKYNSSHPEGKIIRDIEGSISQPGKDSRWKTVRVREILE